MVHYLHLLGTLSEVIRTWVALSVNMQRSNGSVMVTAFCSPCPHERYSAGNDGRKYSNVYTGSGCKLLKTDNRSELVILCVTPCRKSAGFNGLAKIDTKCQVIICRSSRTDPGDGIGQ
jgi:hypothetical protein